MAEGGLHQVDGRATLESVSGVRVAQPVRRNVRAGLELSAPGFCQVGNSVVGMTFAIALFERITNPTVLPKTVTIDELTTILTRFEVLPDKHLGQCWSPTKYAGGAKTRGNAGVEEVSCLVFDCDRVGPDPKRLKGIYWIGHTTHSHTTVAPRWRVVIPLARPMPVQAWGDVWRRARAALCPEADPACKDPSRAYWLPAHDGGLAAKPRVNEGPLLDPSTLPPLPSEPRREMSTPARKSGARSSPEAYMCQVLDNLATVAPGGRNAALNHAAWTLAALASPV